MTYSPLNDFLLSELFAFILIFCRIGSAIMIMPGIGESYVSPRVRLLFSLVLSIMLTPLLKKTIPMMPEAGLSLFMLIGAEILVGLFIGTVARTLLIAVHVAGHIMALQSSLASATVFDPNSGGQSAVISNLLSLCAITLFFVLNLHHLTIAAIVQSYDVFTPGRLPNISDMNMLHLRIFADSFALGVMLAAPHIVFGLLFNLVGGLMNRVMPSFQVFFVLMSPQILLSLLLLFATVSMVLQVFMNFMQEQLSHFTTPI
jgi:flagellar biosynthetic protein FliR